jgi:predicted GNAT family acetyltransferase
MLALATLAKPGPFTIKSLALGNFWGIRIGGRLVAMAGERLKQPGFTELSGVCVDPSYRGRGYASRLSQFVSRRIVAAGDIAYLHVHSGNIPAMSIGFHARADIVAATLTPTE